MRGQVSLEFMVFFGLLLLVSLLASGVALSTANQIGEDGVNRDAKRLALLAATEINIAYGVGDGYSHNFTLPPKLKDGSDYEIFVDSQTLYVSWNNRRYLLPLLTDAVNTTTGNRTLPNGNRIIRNIAGVLEIV